MEFHAAVGHLGHFAEQADEAARNGVLVSEPEVEDVAKHNDPFGLGRYSVEPANKVKFALSCICSAAQVCVGDEIGLLPHLLVFNL